MIHCAIKVRNGDVYFSNSLNTYFYVALILQLYTLPFFHRRTDVTIKGTKEGVGLPKSDVSISLRKTNRPFLREDYSGGTKTHPHCVARVTLNL